MGQLLASCGYGRTRGVQGKSLETLMEHGRQWFQAGLDKKKSEKDATEEFTEAKKHFEEVVKKAISVNEQRTEWRAKVNLVC